MGNQRSRGWRGGAECAPTFQLGLLGKTLLAVGAVIDVGAEQAFQQTAVVLAAVFKICGSKGRANVGSNAVTPGCGDQGAIAGRNPRAGHTRRAAKGQNSVVFRFLISAVFAARSRFGQQRKVFGHFQRLGRHDAKFVRAVRVRAQMHQAGRFVTITATRHNKQRRARYRENKPCCRHATLLDLFSPF